MEPVDDVVVTSPDADHFSDPRIDDLPGQLASTRVDVVSLSSKRCDLVKKHYKSKLKHEELWRKVFAEANEVGGAYRC